MTAPFAVRARALSSLVALLLAACAELPLTSAPTGLGDLSPAEALRAFETEPGFAVELVASEPLTIDPVALAFDEHGRLFVAEDRDYPVGLPDGRPLGVIARLEDTDGDGRMDKRAEFAAGLKFPNGVMAWRGGVIVTAAPDVWWLADTNGDGRADVKELLLTGFDTSSTSQLRVNDPTLGPDGWVYLAGGLRGGKVSSPKRPGVIVDTEKGDLRFRPDTGEMKLTEGKSQFGLAFDDAGNRFACMNRIQSQHAPLAARYLARNPFLLPPGVLHSCPELIENKLLVRQGNSGARIFPISANLTTADSHAGTYSAACAVHIYRGTALPEAYRGAAFSCDPTGNLVRGDRLEAAGGTFAARRIRENAEALRSRDDWFRPVFIADGPDGALYIADMYRKTIEHPEYLPEEVRKHTDFESGKDKGRIWRLSGIKSGPVGQSSKPGRDLVGREPVDWVKELNSPIPWRRDTAFRLLVEKGDVSLGDALRKAFTKTTAAGTAVLQLQLLENWRVLDHATLEQALKHASPQVRQNAARLAESRLATQPRLLNHLLELADDPDPHVRFQAALSLGEVRDARVVPALLRIARRQASDRWTRAAILSALGERENAFPLLESLAGVQTNLNDGLIALAGDLGRQLASNLTEKERPTLFPELWRRLASADATLNIAATAGAAKAAGNEFRSIVAARPSDTRALLTQARALAAQASAGLETRLRAFDLLAFDDLPETTALLTKFLDAAHPHELQQAAAQALFQSWRAAALPPLLSHDRWNAHTPAARSVMLNRLAGRPEFAALLLDALESEAIPLNVLTPAQRDSLRKSKDETVRTRAGKLFATVGGSREESFAQAKTALLLTPAPANGRAVFEKACASCHRFNQVGVAVGPDLFDIRNQPKESILYHIVVPEAEIAPNFVNYECELKDGRTLSGLLAAETSAQITLRMGQALEEVVSRAQIARLTASRLSLMPQELEKAMTPQELADLLAYLKGEQ